MTEEQIKRARAKSVGNSKKSRYVQMDRTKYLTNIKKSFFIGAVSAIMAGSALVMGSNHIITNINNNKIVNEELSEYKDLVNSETNRTSNKEGYYYDTVDLGSHLADHKEDFDKELFGIYSNIDTNRIEQMNNIVRIADGKLGDSLDITDNFEKYVIDKGFVTKDGKPDYEAYGKEMTKFVVNEHNISEMQNANNSLKSR